MQIPLDTWNTLKLEKGCDKLEKSCDKSCDKLEKSCEKNLKKVVKNISKSTKYPFEDLKTAWRKHCFILYFEYGLHRWLLVSLFQNTTILDFKGARWIFPLYWVILTTTKNFGALAQAEVLPQPQPRVSNPKGPPFGSKKINFHFFHFLWSQNIRKSPLIPKMYNTWGKFCFKWSKKWKRPHLATFLVKKWPNEAFFIFFTT